MLTVLVALAVPDRGHAAGAADLPFTVAKYPIQAVAQNAVAAKERAMADGQQAAFRSLLKRLVPVTQQARINTLKDVKVTNLVTGVAVRSEQNSSTEYIATLDFSFDPAAVRQILQTRGLPFVDEQAPELTIVPVYLPPAGNPPANYSAAALARTWTDVWKGLDLDHALAPAKLVALPGNVTAEAVRQVATQPDGVVRLLAGPVKSDFVVVAVLEPDLTKGKLNITMTGQDAVGLFTISRGWRLDPDDVSYTAELGAVVATGILDGRWKAVRRGSQSASGSGYGGGEVVQLTIEYRNAAEWQDIRQRIMTLPGVSGFDTSGFSTRSATATVRFPGGGQAFSDALVTQGLAAYANGGSWLVRSAY